MATTDANLVPGDHGEFAFEARLVEDGGAVRLVIRDGRVAELDRLDRDPTTDTWISPGWIDVQVNGFGGHDPNAVDATASNVIEMVRALWEQGTTAVCPTICTQSEQHILRSIRAVVEARRSDPLVAGSIVGIHIEGPHISLEDGPRGAHPLEHVRPPDLAEYQRWQEAAEGLVRIITLSPEYPGAADYVRAIVSDGVIASVGHTGASSDQIQAAVDAGARWSTHLGNGAHATLPRHPNYIWDQLAEDRLSAGFIFDGHHLPPAVMRSVIRAKGLERSVLVTDAIAIAGLPPGVYPSAVGGTVELLPSGRLILSGTPYLAGSAATLPICLGNAVRHAGITVREAVRMVTANPSRLLGLGVARGHETTRTGVEANLTLFRQAAGSGDPEVVGTIVAGQLVSGVAG